MSSDSPTFPFGKNWSNFLAVLDEDRIKRSEDHIRSMLDRESLEGMRFLDAGCGSGLSSLAALKLGADEVVSFDVDNDSVNCTKYLKNAYGPFPQWHIKQGSVLDHEWISSLGQFDIVYSWGVLHHTGAMWDALQNIIPAVREGGVMYIALYNDQGALSSLWKRIKRLYSQAPKPIGTVIAGGYFLLMLLTAIVKGILHMRPPREWFSDSRGMHLWYDAVDWVGGYPFETAKPEEVFRFMRDRGFTLLEMRLKTGSGCNEYIFNRAHPGKNGVGSN